MADDDDKRFEEIRSRFRQDAATIWSPWEHQGALYHYTKPDGLQGILESRTLWLSCVLDMDDKREFVHGLEVAREVLAENGDFFTLVPSLQDEAKWRNLIGATGYAACFCTDGDKRSQWDRYADGGHGYAIEFDYDRLLELGAEQNQFTLFRVVYDDSCQRDIVRRQLDSAWTCWLDSGLLDDRERLRIELARQLVACAALFKCGNLREEDECRLLKMSTDQPQTRTLPDRRTVSYVAQAFGREQVRSIVLGPRGDPDRRTAALRAILREKGFDAVKATRSRIAL